MNNYSNVDFISVEKIIVDKVFNQRVNLDSLQLEDYANIVQNPN